ncbi:hypothetical protein HIM_10197 [Hirsutella minnesotensis 3608]|uniref:Integrase catalytic domain-containing protein n=1 Tax=Hirsutella minnesotensis 3608 TaxID=1043627 RepID=A0A0F7ZRX9_9HYPO|nr:hypothetical protein HIM_10197 [Hirsutella minnesotensis 3608]
MPTVQLRKNATIATVRFGGNEPTNTIGITTVITPIGEVVFHVINMSTPFLLCLKDMDRLGAYLNNVTNELICGDKRIPIVRKWGHPWFFLRKEEAAIAFLSEAELRRLHTRFGHPSVHKLHKLLTNAGHNVEFEAIAMLRKFCHFCQIKADAPRRFKFTLKDDCDFNYELIVDVMHLDGRPVLHAVDLATSFQAGRFLQNMSAKGTWEVLKLCWIDTYLGPPDVITHDAGTNFASSEFQAEAKLMGITCHQVPVEAHWSIGKVERYHAPIRRAYEILKAELKETVTADSLLQMAFKSVNDTAGPDGLVPTLLVFGAYPRITMDSPPSASAISRAKAVTKAMTELRKLMAERKVNRALNARNGPNTIEMLPMSLPLGKVLAVTDADVIVELDNGPAKFRATVVQPYFRHPDSQQPQDADIPQTPLGNTLQVLLDKLQLCQRALGENYRDDGLDHKPPWIAANPARCVYGFVQPHERYHDAARRLGIAEGRCDCMIDDFDFGLDTFLMCCLGVVFSALCSILKEMPVSDHLYDRAHIAGGYHVRQQGTTITRIHTQPIKPHGMV